MTLAMAVAFTLIVAVDCMWFSWSVRVWPVFNLFLVLKDILTNGLLPITSWFVVAMVCDVFFGNPRWSIPRGAAVFGRFFIGLIAASVGALVIDVPRSASGLFLTAAVQLWEERNFPLFTMLEASLVVLVALGVGFFGYQIVDEG